MKPKKEKVKRRGQKDEKYCTVWMWLAGRDRGWQVAETLLSQLLASTGRCNSSWEGTSICQLPHIKSKVSMVAALKQGTETYTAPGLLQCRKHFPTVRWIRRNLSYLVGICQILIEISPNREEGINLTELFNSWLKEQFANMQEMCSHLAVKSP